MPREIPVRELPMPCSHEPALPEKAECRAYAQNFGKEQSYVPENLLGKIFLEHRRDVRQYFFCGLFY